jgi:hypothetical protein
MITTTLDKQTGNGRLVNTERQWVASNGHVVTVLTRQNITSRTTWSSRNAAFAEVNYICECGRTKRNQGSPKKAELENHDNWFTPEQIANINKMIWQAN